MTRMCARTPLVLAILAALACGPHASDDATGSTSSASTSTSSSTGGATSTGDATTSTSAVATGDTTAETPQCMSLDHSCKEGGVEVVQDAPGFPLSGLEQCWDEVVHRYEPVECAVSGVCTSDADCGPDAACLCTGYTPWDCGVFWVGGGCYPANCRRDTDCGEYLCAVSIGKCFYAEGLYCHSAADECQSDRDCKVSPLHRCAFNGDQQRWVCDSYASCE